MGWMVVQGQAQGSILECLQALRHFLGGHCFSSTRKMCLYESGERHLDHHSQQKASRHRAEGMGYLPCQAYKTKRKKSGDARDGFFGDGVYADLDHFDADDDADAGGDDDAGHVRAQRNPVR